MSNFNRRRLLASAAAFAALPSWPRIAAANAPVIRISSVKSGSVAWLIDTLKNEKLPEKHGFELHVVEVANNQAAPVALLAGECDVVVSDWTWAMRQRAKGNDFKFAPYSTTLGSLMVPADSPIKTLADLKGKKLGVAGTGIDKSWILLRAYSRKVLGEDISTYAQPVFGAAPLITEEFRSGRVDACLNFWTYAARLAGTGSRQLLSMSDVMQALDVTPPPALVGFIWSEKAVAEKAVPVDNLLAAVNDANVVLAKSDEAWERLRGLIKPATDAELVSIRDFFRAGITTGWTATDTASAEKLTKLLIELGDTELVGDGTRFDATLFYPART